MRSRTTARFRDLLAAVPAEVRAKADAAYALWANNPWHPSLRFKKVHSSLPIYPVRIDLNWRAVGVQQDDAMVWFWIGTHADYEKLPASL